jgi:hypothetical protein
VLLQTDLQSKFEQRKITSEDVISQFVISVLSDNRFALGVERAKQEQPRPIITCGEYVYFLRTLRQQCSFVASVANPFEVSTIYTRTTVARGE